MPYGGHTYGAGHYGGSIKPLPTTIPVNYIVEARGMSFEALERDSAYAVEARVSDFSTIPHQSSMVISARKDGFVIGERETEFVVTEKKS